MKRLLRLTHSFWLKFVLLAVLFLFLGLSAYFLHDKPEFFFPCLTFILSSIGFCVSRTQLKINEKPIKKHSVENDKKTISYKIGIQNKSLFPARNCKLKITFQVSEYNTIKDNSDAHIKKKEEYPEEGIINDPILWDEYIDTKENKSTTYHLGARDSITAELFSWYTNEKEIRIASEISNKARIVLEEKVDLEIKIRLTGDNFFPLEETFKINKKEEIEPIMTILRS